MRYLRHKSGELVECKVNLHGLIEIGNNFYTLRELENLGFELVPETEKRWLWIFDLGKKLIRNDNLWMTRMEAESHAAGMDYTLLGRDENVKISIDDMDFEGGE